MTAAPGASLTEAAPSIATDVPSLTDAADSVKRQRVTGLMEPWLGRFGGLRREGSQLVARCPAHSDDNPSLAIGLGGRGAEVVLKCRAGCATDRVLAAVELGFTDLDPGDVRAALAGYGLSTTAPAAGDPRADPGLLEALVRDVIRPAETALVERAEAQPARAMLAERHGLGLLDAERLRIGWTPATPRRLLNGAWTCFPRLLVPYRDRAGRLVGAQGRALAPDPAHVPDQLRWVSLTGPWSPVGYFPAARDREAGRFSTMVTEGTSDALTAVGLGRNAVAVAGAARNPSKVAERIAPWSTSAGFEVVGDGDEAGQRFVDAMVQALRMRHLSARRSALVIPPGQDLTDAYRPGSRARLKLLR